MSRESKIVLVCSDGDSTRAIANALERRFGRITVVMEKPVSKWVMLKRRAKKLGVLTTAGQVVFIVLLVPLLRRLSRHRIAEIERQHGLKTDFESPVIKVDSINSQKALEAIKEASPNVVVVSGTRIIGKNTLNSVSATFINMHAGITPLYRGVHGGYWALFENKPELVGSTVHMVDPGIDTGGVIERAYFPIEKSDSFATYPYLHTAYGIPALVRAVENSLSDRPRVAFEENGLESKLRYHPTIWQYLYGRLFRGIR